jgi:hypothetical protein
VCILLTSQKLVSPPSSQTFHSINFDSDISIFNNPSQVFSISSQNELRVPNSLANSSNTQESELSSSSSVMAFQYIQSVIETESCCFICKSRNDRKAVPWKAISQVWFRQMVYIPKKNRACSSHFTSEKLFTQEALDQIEASKQRIHVKKYDFGLWLHHVCDIKQPNPISFQGPLQLPESRYKTFVGLEKNNFNNLFSFIESRIRNTSNRTAKDALGMFLILLRTNNTQEFIAHLFGTTQRIVSEAISSVGLALEEDFVPKFLGYSHTHMSREEALEKHSIKLTSGVLQQDASRLCLMADCTYIYIEKPGDFFLQRKTFSAHKMRNLLKPLLICLPSGYIIECAGPYYTDSENNDAACIRHHYDTSNSDILHFLEDGDYFIFDRGFRDVVEETKSNGHSVFMPAMLDRKTKRFTCEQANASRKVITHLLLFFI